MDSVQIDALLQKDRRTRDIFRGVYPSDKLSESPVNGLYIVNLDPSHLPGSHWVAIYVRDQFAEYFDSYGLHPFIPNILKFLHPFTLSRNRVQIQSFHSDICGEYCCLYALSKSLGHSLHYFLKQFHHLIPHRNDCWALTLFHHNFPLEKARLGRKCHPLAQRCCSRINAESASSEGSL